MESCNLSGHRGYIIGRVSTELFYEYCRKVSRSADFFDDDETMIDRAVKRLIRDFYPNIVEWLKAHECLNSFSWIEDHKEKIVSLIIMFRPGQKNLETMFVLRWS
jgi:hypothetical protein